MGDRTMKHILNRRSSVDGTETQIELFDDSNNTLQWVKCTPATKDVSFKESEVKEK